MLCTSYLDLWGHWISLYYLLPTHPPTHQSLLSSPYTKLNIEPNIHLICVDYFHESFCKISFNMHCLKLWKCDVRHIIYTFLLGRQERCCIQDIYLHSSRLLSTLLLWANSTANNTENQLLLACKKINFTRFLRALLSWIFLTVNPT
jgi:hypothetical protein